MKKPAKKAAKKATEKRKPLIEGKYSHKFLTRLEPDLGAKLEELKKVLYIKTYNGVVSRLIRDYQRLRNEHTKVLEDNEVMNNKLSAVKTILSKRLELEEYLTKIAKQKD